MTIIDYILTLTQMDSLPLDHLTPPFPFLSLLPLLLLQHILPQLLRLLLELATRMDQYRPLRPLPLHLLHLRHRQVQERRPLIITLTLLHLDMDQARYVLVKLLRQ